MEAGGGVHGGIRDPRAILINLSRTGIRARDFEPIARRFDPSNVAAAQESLGVERRFRSAVCNMSNLYSTIGNEDTIIALFVLRFEVGPVQWRRRRRRAPWNCARLTRVATAVAMIVGASSVQPVAVSLRACRARIHSIFRTIVAGTVEHGNFQFLHVDIYGIFGRQ